MDYRERWELKDYLIGQRLERRVRLLHVLVAVLCSLFLLDFWYLQGVHGDDYAALAEDNRLRRLPLKPTRGVIRDRHGEVIAATRPSLDLRLLRDDRHDKEPQLERLAGILGRPVEELQERLESMRRRPLYEPLVLVEDVDLALVAQIEARREDFPSIDVAEAARRYYPRGDGFSHVVGYVGEVSEKQLADSDGTLHSGDIVGKAGVEKAYDAPVRGDRGWRLVTVNNLGRPIGRAEVAEAPRHGDDVALTIDAALQEELAAAFGEEAGAGVFLDPESGEVLAILSRPGYDPNLFADGISRADWQGIVSDPRRPMHDRAIASFYAPGSIFKVVMAIAALEEGLVDGESENYCPGHASFYGRRRLCWKRGGHGDVAVREAIAKSCNVYFYRLGKELGIETIHDYGERFGLGRTTRIDLPAEEAGILPSHEWKRRQLREIWYPGDTISVAIGQGYLTVTPLQMVRMIAVIANGGSRVTPHVVAGRARPSEPSGFRPEHVEFVRGGLADAVRLGTATRAALDGISVAGKTGTAQVHSRSATEDSDDLPKPLRSHAWFVGFAPVDKPQIAFAVIVEHGGHGGSSAAPIARRVLERFFDQQQPDEPERPPSDARAAVEAPDGDAVAR